VRRDDRVLIENKSKFILCKASSGHKHALEEVFSDPKIMSQITETKVAKEVVVLNKFMRMIYSHPEKAYYGYNHVSRANEEFAIESLLVTDKLFRSSNVQTRKKYVNLVETVRQNGGETFIFSSMHVSGSQLQQVSGVAAILRYPLPNLDDLEEPTDKYSSSEDEDDNADQQKIDKIQEDMESMGF